MEVSIVILAAGKGSRMKSKLPKVLHSLAGKPMVEHVVEAARQFSSDINIVVGHGADAVKNHFQGEEVKFHLQSEQLGTGHAVAQALPGVEKNSVVLVLYGDVPLIKPSTLSRLIAACSDRELGLLTVTMEDPTGYGRIIRNADGTVTKIVEQKDASDTEQAVREVNTGILAVPAWMLHDWLPTLSNDNAQGEYYLTDLIAIAVDHGIEVTTVSPDSVEETLGVNNRQQLAQLERWHQLQLATELMANGATLADPARIDVRGTLSTAEDCFIDVNCVFAGEVVLGEGVVIGPNCNLRNAVIGSHTRIEANTVIDDARIGQDATVGPFARIRPGTELADHTKIGNFVETKKAVLGAGSKVNHLSYIGDAVIGEGSNIGAGTITCNYDGVNKHKTDIGDGAFIGSNSTLVAPVEIGDGAFIGAGSVITKTAPSDQLTLGRTRQVTISKWQKPKKQQ